VGQRRCARHDVAVKVEKRCRGAPGAYHGVIRLLRGAGSAARKAGHGEVSCGGDDAVLMAELVVQPTMTRPGVANGLGARATTRQNDGREELEEDATAVANLIGAGELCRRRALRRRRFGGLGLDRGEQGGGAVPAAACAPVGKLLRATAEKGCEGMGSHRRRASRGAACSSLATLVHVSMLHILVSPFSPDFM
jgi:hypothetical protein